MTQNPGPPSEAAVDEQAREEVANLAGTLRLAADQARTTAGRINNPKWQGMLEADAEVLTAMLGVFERYESST